ncbi:hypothetical protein DL764_004671 [Monosporascus ibericus]|uniref:Uncharacterized protein n=1 Tax=Monosporascus ibericus TaxID=155417 RepID=A0A4Q4TEK6_9PEZI|nr:hypothetical protein DL764_004671 [Monosporascus ibericus]
MVYAKLETVVVSVRRGDIHAGERAHIVTYKSAAGSATTEWHCNAVAYNDAALGSSWLLIGTGNAFENWPVVGRFVDLAPFTSRFHTSGTAVLPDNGREEYGRIKEQALKPDVVILATGYTQRFSFFADGSYPSPEEGNVQNLWCRDDPTMTFIGHIRPAFGAIPPLAELQAMLWTMNLLADSRLRYSVEHESYAYQIAKDMGSAPGVIEVLTVAFTSKVPRAWYRLPIVWAAGSSYVTKFRLGSP